MFFSKSNADGNYEKIFFDFKIKSITGDMIDLNMTESHGTETGSGLYDIMSSWI